MSFPESDLNGQAGLDDPLDGVVGPKAALAALLVQRFPWLGDGDAFEYPDSGADLIEELEMFYRELLV